MPAMSHDPHADDALDHPGSAGLHHATDDHGDDHGHDDHAHPEAPLGPIDAAAWGAGALGIVVGVVIAACFAVATGALTL